MKTIQASDDNTKGGYNTDITGADLGNGKRALHVFGKALVLGTDYDTIDVTYPTTTTERYSYKLDAVEILLVEVTYSTSAKEILTKVEVL